MGPTDAIPSENAEPKPDAPTTGSQVIDVLVLYTGAARDAAGDSNAIETTIRNAVDVANAAYEYSKVDQRLNLVAAWHYEYEEVGLDMVSQLVDLRLSADVATLRDAHGADLVALVTELGPGNCGAAYVMREVSTNFAPWAFSVTRRDCLVGSMSFAHELGHNMGLEHDPDSADVAPDAISYPHSHGHYLDGSFRTVMSPAGHCTGGCTEQPLFSNPNVLYNDVPTGIVNERDNALTLDLTAPTVSTFRTK
jgi:hypothetical protein